MVRDVKSWKFSNITLAESLKNLQMMNSFKKYEKAEIAKAGHISLKMNENIDVDLTVTKRSELVNLVLIIQIMEPL